MQKLIDSGLYGEGLLWVQTPALVARYLACLNDMGILEKYPAELRAAVEVLTEFRIDGLGWSPEIAKLLCDEYYLSHGDANPLAIVMFPEQRNTPIWRPPYSFVWDMMKVWMDLNRAQVRFLTTRTAIWLDFEDGVDLFEDREDLLRMDGVRIVARTPDRLMHKAARQRQLVHDFMRADDPEALAHLAEELAKLTGEIGNLSEQPVVIEDMVYSGVRNFYSRAFGGLFVLRPNGDGSHLLLTKEKALSGVGVTSPSDRKILAKLEQMGLISYELTWWQGHLGRLEIVQESFLMDVLDQYDPDVDYGALEEAHRKALLVRHKDHLPKEYHQLARVMKKIQSREVVENIPANIKAFFAHPRPDLDESLQEVVWHILTLVCDLRQVVRLYRYDKDMFFARYVTWSFVRKHWAMDAIKTYYEPRMMKQLQQHSKK